MAVLLWPLPLEPFLDRAHAATIVELQPLPQQLGLGLPQASRRAGLLQMQGRLAMGAQRLKFVGPKQLDCRAVLLLLLP